MPRTGSEIRSERRRPLLIKARLIGDEVVASCMVTDLSGDGCRAVLTAWTSVPRAVVVELDGQSRWDAVCQWQRGLNAGFRFIKAL